MLWVDLPNAAGRRSEGGGDQCWNMKTSGIVLGKRRYLVCAIQLFRVERPFIAAILFIERTAEAAVKWASRVMSLKTQCIMGARWIPCGAPSRPERR
jgi:hypothetical protein